MECGCSAVDSHISNYITEEVDEPWKHHFFINLHFHELSPIIILNNVLTTDGKFVAIITFVGGQDFSLPYNSS